MTEEQIIKALECCVSDDQGNHYVCRDCPLHDKDVKCPEYIRTETLDIINRQKAEIERLKEAIVSKNLTPIAYKVRQEHDEKHIHIINGLEAEIERLKNENFCLGNERDALLDVMDTAVSEAIKEFAKEFVADLSHMITYDKDYIKAKIFHLVEIKTKEMEGGEADA